MQSEKKRYHFNKIYTANNETEGATRGVLEKKKLFLKISQNSQKNTCTRDSCNIVAGLSLQLY